MHELSDFQTYNPVQTLTNILDVEQLRTKMPVTTQLFFGESFENTKWNREILWKLAEAIQKARVDGNWNVPEVDTEYIHTELYTQLRQARAYWKSSQPKFGESQGVADTRVANLREERAGKAKHDMRKIRVSDKHYTTTDVDSPVGRG